MNEKEMNYVFDMIDNHNSENERTTFSEKEVKFKKVSEFNTTENSIVRYRFNEGEIFKFIFNLKKLDLGKYFNMSDEERSFYEGFQNDGLLEYLINEIRSNKKELGFDDNFDFTATINDNELIVYFNKCNQSLIDFCNERIRKYYSDREIHITRMFGSYILLCKINGELKAVKATPIPIKYCPLMIKLLKEVGGDYAEILIKTLSNSDEKKQTEAMCQLINEVVIKGGYFDTNRPLNSCEANVLFGASETMASAFKNNIIDAAVIVSNNLGTIITTNNSNTQGAVKRMTGLFYTTPSENIVSTALESGIIPVFPYTGKIDQLEGVKKAIELGYKSIAVSVAASDNYLHKDLKELEKCGVKIYKFGLCSTGIDMETAEIMKRNADVIWSCASKYVKELIEPSAIAQVGVKIPVHIMTKDGYEIVKNHLLEMNNSLNFDDVNLSQGDEKPVFLNHEGNINVVQRKYLRKCNDCPNPCV